MVADECGWILVADRKHNRILMLDSELRLRRNLLSDDDPTFNFPYRICVDAENGRLLVGQREFGVAVYKLRVRSVRLVKVWQFLR